MGIGLRVIVFQQGTLGPQFEKQEGAWGACNRVGVFSNLRNILKNYLFPLVKNHPGALLTVVNKLSSILKKGGGKSHSFRNLDVAGKELSEMRRDFMIQVRQPNTKTSKL